MKEPRFVVKATGPDATYERWITTPRRNGMRAFGPRTLAALFLRWDGAEQAILEIRNSENCDEIAFEVQTIAPSE